MRHGALPRPQLAEDTLHRKMVGAPFTDPCSPEVPVTLLLLMFTSSSSDRELLQGGICIFYFTWQGAGECQEALNKCQMTRGMHSRKKCNAAICQALDGIR